MTTTPQNATRYWLEVCRDHALIRGQMKTAELGGGQDTPFEQAFSNLAHAYIKDKAPKLLEYEVGFQLLEKNQENTKAVGVFGFKVGSQWIYAPVFFLNGDLKGHELLYLKSQDQFLPLKENWINHVLGKKPSVLGDGVNRNLSQLGVMPPNLYQLSRSPNKFASHDESEETDEEIERLPHKEPDTDEEAPGMTVERVVHKEPDYDTDCCDAPVKAGGLKIASWAKDFLPILGYLTMVPPAQKYAGMKGFSDLIKEGGEDTLRFVIEKVGETYPTIIQSIDKIYGPELLTEAAREASKARKQAASNSLVKEAVVASAGEHPKGWNGGIRPPSKENGGKMTTGEEAWESSHKQDGGLSRRFEKKHGGAQKGHIKDLFKMSNYPGCGTHPMRPKKMKKKVEEKKASIIPSILGPLVSGELKHKVVSREMVDNDPNIVHSLKSDERATLLKERHVFSDKRDIKDVTIAYDVQTPLKLYNPDHTGVYYVLCQPDKFVKCLVILGPHSSSQRHNFATVVRLDGKKNYTNTHPANIWVRAEMDRDQWTKWLKDQPDAGTVPLAPREDRWKYETRHVLLGPSGQGTCPFMATEKYTGKENESVVYDVRWEDHNYSSRPAYLPDHSKHLRDPYMHMGSCSGASDQLVMTKLPGIKLKVLNGQLLVPGEYKMLKVRDEENASESNNEPVRLGNLLDAQMAIMANTQPLRVVMDGADVKVDENRMDKTSALAHLFFDHGLSEKAAKLLLTRVQKEGRVEVRVAYPDYIQNQWEQGEKEAGVGDFLMGRGKDYHKAQKWLKTRTHPDTGHFMQDDEVNITPKKRFKKEEKQAANDMISGAPNAPNFPEPYWGYDPMTGGNVPTMQPSEFNQKIPDMSASKTDRSIYYPFGPDPKAMQVAQEASQSGQREIFDTAMLGGLLKAVRQDGIVDKYMGDLKKGLDRLGRLLFLYYWHGEEFEDRYGKQDMPELEDGLRNGFENVGDIVLKLMQKTVEVSPDEGTAVDLGAIANQ